MTSRARTQSLRPHNARQAHVFAPVVAAPPVVLPHDIKFETAPVIDFVTRAPFSSVDIDVAPPVVSPVAPFMESCPTSTGIRWGLLTSVTVHTIALAALLIGPLLTRDLPPAGGEQAIPIEFLVVSPSAEELVEGGASGAIVHVELPLEVAPPTELALSTIDIPPPQHEPISLQELADMGLTAAVGEPPVAVVTEPEALPPAEKIDIIEPVVPLKVKQAPPKPLARDQTEPRRQRALRAAALKAQQDTREEQEEAQQTRLELAQEKRKRAREAARRKTTLTASQPERLQAASRPAASTVVNSQGSRPVAAGRTGAGAAANTSPRGGATNGDSASAGAAQVASWRSQVIAHLARFKRYPAAAEEREITGRSGLSFTLSKSGQVLGVSLAGSSGHGMLDQEALAMVRRAAPFPAAPSGAPVTHSFNTAVRFDMR